MCGITGFLSGRSGNPDQASAVLGRMTAALRHRGPDAGGSWQSGDGRVNFGHRRLAIIDLSPTGRQPMSTADGRFVLSFNGEIYNYVELRQELEGKGHSFVGASDTEVLLQALAAWGIEPALRRLNGMFAFSLWDARTQALWLARDRFGEKPLYYAWHHETFLFGSELKALGEHPAFRREIDPDVLALFMRFNYVPWPHCIFKGANMLPPGHCLRLIPGAAPGEPQPYWSPRELVEDRELLKLQPDDPALVDLLEGTLRQAVKMRMVADVPLGAFLSGGIDSSLVVALMQAQSARPVKTFTIGFEEAAYNEATDAARIARHLGTEHQELYLSSRETLEVIPRLPEIYDEPFADASQIPTILVSRFARKHVTVALSGDAGDELFGGYNRYVWSARFWPKLARIPRGLRRGLGQLLLGLSPGTWDRFIAAANLVVPKRLRTRGGGEKLHKSAGAMQARDENDLYRRLVSHWQDPLAVVAAARGEPATLLNHPESFPANLNLVERMMYLDLLTYLPGDILCKVDRASMSTGLEARVPFLDNEVARLAWNLPPGSRLHHGVGKWPLRQVLKRHVPEKYFERPKMGFGIPIGEWLRGPLRDWAEDLLAERRLRDGGYFNVGTVREQWRKHLSGRSNLQYSLWSILSFQAWIKNNGING